MPPYGVGQLDFHPQRIRMRLHRRAVVAFLLQAVQACSLKISKIRNTT